MARPKKSRLIKNYYQYAKEHIGYADDECHYQLIDGTQCANRICYASRHHSMRFCTEHWPICKFCNKELPTFNTGRLKHHCECERVSSLYEMATKAGRDRRMWKELIQSAFNPLRIHLQWNITGSHYTVVLNKKTSSDLVWIGACSIAISPNKDMIIIKDAHGRVIEPTVNIADPAFGHRIVEGIFDAIAGLQLRQREATCAAHISLYDTLTWEQADINLLGPKDPRYAGILERYQSGINQALAALREGLEVLKSNASGHGKFAQQVLDRELDTGSQEEITESAAPKQWPKD